MRVARTLAVVGGLLAIVGGAIALAAWQLGVSIGVSVNNTATCLKTKVC